MTAHPQRLASTGLPVDPETSSKKVRLVVIFAVVGAVLITFEIFVLARWIFGSNFKPTPPGPDELTGGQHALAMALQIGVPIAFAILMYVWVVRPWRHEGHLTTDGMLALSGAMLFFWDMSMNYTSVSLLYNSHLVNRGSWANGSWPTWISPGASNLPEPIFVAIPGYGAMVYSQAVFVLWLLRKAKKRWPDLGVMGTIATMIVGLTIVDTIIEMLLMSTGLYAYPGGIRVITLFAGETYQLPLSETFLFGGLGLSAIAALSYFRDDRGRTIVERGVDTLKVSTKGRTLVRFCAVFGAVHLSFILLYSVPQQWFAVHSDQFPEGYKSYMINDMCKSGVDGNTCPGPGVPMVRP